VLLLADKEEFVLLTKGLALLLKFGSLLHDFVRLVLLLVQNSEVELGLFFTQLDNVLISIQELY